MNPVNALAQEIVWNLIKKGLVSQHNADRNEVYKAVKDCLDMRIEQLNCQQSLSYSTLDYFKGNASELERKVKSMLIDELADCLVKSNDYVSYEELNGQYSRHTTATIYIMKGAETTSRENKEIL